MKRKRVQKVYPEIKAYVTRVRTMQNILNSKTKEEKDEAIDTEVSRNIIPAQESDNKSVTLDKIAKKWKMTEEMSDSDEEEVSQNNISEEESDDENVTLDKIAKKWEVITQEISDSDEEEVSRNIPAQESDDESVTLDKITKKGKMTEEMSDPDEEEVSPLETPELSAYEKLRLKNIKRNKEMMRFLDFDKIASDMKASKKTSTPRLKQKVDLTPTRRSSRIQFKGEGKTLQTQFYTPVDFQWKRKPSGPIDIEPLNEIDDKDSEAFLKSLVGLRQGESKVLKHEERSPSKAVEEFSNKISMLQVLPENVCKVVPSRVCSMAFHPTSVKPILCVGDRHGSIGFWDLEGRGMNNGIYMYDPHTSAVTTLSFHPENDKMYSSSYDGTVRCADFNCCIFDEIYRTPVDNNNTGVTALSFPCMSRDTVLVSLRDGYVTLVDTRQQTRAENRYKCHQRSIKHLHCSPTNANLFCTSSLDTTIALWDIRNLKNERSKLHSVSFGRLVSSVYFSPITGNQVLTTSLDDHVCVFDVTPEGKLTKNRSFSHCNRTGRWLTPFRATWDPHDDGGIVVGSMHSVRRVDVYHSRQKLSTSPLFHLYNENFGTITSINVFHPKRNLLASGNSSGKVYIWTEEKSR